MSHKLLKICIYALKIKSYFSGIQRKNWSIAAQEIIYDYVYFADYCEIDLFIVSIAMPHNKGGMLVKSLSLAMDPYFIATIHMLDKIAIFWPNLERYFKNQTKLRLETIC